MAPGVKADASGDEKEKGGCVLHGQRVGQGGLGGWWMSGCAR